MKNARNRVIHKLSSRQLEVAEKFIRLILSLKSGIVVPKGFVCPKMLNL